MMIGMIMVIGMIVMVGMIKVIRMIMAIRMVGTTMTIGITTDLRLSARLIPRFSSSSALCVTSCQWKTPVQIDSRLFPF